MATISGLRSSTEGTMKSLIPGWSATLTSASAARARGEQLRRPELLTGVRDEIAQRAAIERLRVAKVAADELAPQNASNSALSSAAKSRISAPARNRVSTRRAATEPPPITPTRRFLTSRNRGRRLHSGLVVQQSLLPLREKRAREARRMRGVAALRPRADGQDRGRAKILPRGFAPFACPAQGPWCFSAMARVPAMAASA